MLLALVVGVVVACGVAGAVGWSLAERRRRADRREMRSALLKVAEFADYSADQFEAALIAVPMAGWHHEVWERAQLGTSTLRGIAETTKAAAAALGD